METLGSENVSHNTSFDENQESLSDDLERQQNNPHTYIHEQEEYGPEEDEDLESDNRE